MGNQAHQSSDLQSSSTLPAAPRQGPHGMGRIAVSVLVFAMLLAACSPSGSTPTPPPNPSGTTMPAQTATPVSLDPCLFINSQEASLFAGASFGEGIESTTSGGARMCTYGSQTTNVFIVEVGQASTPEAAQAFKASFLADIEANLQEAASHGLTVTEQPDFADGGVMFQAAITGSGQTINGGGFGFLKGTIFVGFSDLVVGSSGPTEEAVKAEAASLLARLP